MAVSWQVRAGQWGGVWQPLEWRTGVEEEREVHWQGRLCHSLTHLCLHEKHTNWFTPRVLYIDEVCIEKVIHSSPLFVANSLLATKTNKKTTCDNLFLGWTDNKSFCHLSPFLSPHVFFFFFFYLLFKSVQHWHLVLSSTDAVKPMTTHH